MLEVCVEDIDGLRAAVAGGAGRIELCAALPQGGITPSAALIAAAVAAPIPVHVLIRPRAGNFLYDDDERELMVTDIRVAAASGAAGVAIGASRADATLDVTLLTALVDVAREAGRRRARPVSLTLHRAFDLCPDPLEALEAAIGLGFNRVLTSGCAETAIAGRAVLASLVTRARGRVGILAACGIDASNVDVVLAAGVDEVHSSCQEPRADADPKIIQWEFDAPLPKATSTRRVEALAAAVRRWRAENGRAVPAARM